jgi:16S rRNA (cytidine1402-2'-O)-methyltransferase
VARELSKLHEEVKTASLAELKEHFSKKDVKGEIVVVVAALFWVWTI